MMEKAGGESSDSEPDEITEEKAKRNNRRHYKTASAAVVNGTPDGYGHAVMGEPVMSEGCEP